MELEKHNQAYFDDTFLDEVIKEANEALLLVDDEVLELCEEWEATAEPTIIDEALNALTFEDWSVPTFDEEAITSLITSSEARTTK